LPNWREPLQVKVGVALGKANVGFYGRNLTVKSYTAIGEVIYLACRLCDKVSPSEILIDGNVFESLNKKKYRFFGFNDLNLKGFQSKKIEVLNVLG
jgi:class 3 adenylate cyclase